MDVGQTTVAKYMAKRRRPPSQGWRTFVHTPTPARRSTCSWYRRSRLGFCMDFSSCGSHAASFCGCPSQCGMACPSADRGLRLGRTSTLLDPRPRRRVWRCLHPAHLGHGHSRPPGLGSIRRECLDHVVVVGERHLRHVLASYQTYYNEVRTHLRCRRTRRFGVMYAEQGACVRRRSWAGLHHQYVRV
jgi:hypothetical protein